MTAARLIAAAAIVLTYGCAGHQTGARVTSPREGLYAVASRSCEGPEQAVQECARTHYIELVQGKFYGVPAHAVALVEWRALNPSTGPYTYSARRLRGHPHDANRYVIDTGNGSEHAVRESLLLINNVPVEYQYERGASTSTHEVRTLIRLKLKPVLRNAILAEKLPYPAPAAND